MPATFSTFASTVQGETAFTVLAVAKRLLAAGKDVIELEIGDSPFPTSPAALLAGIQAIDAGHTHYGPSLGLPGFRAAAAEYVRRQYGLPVTADHVVVWQQVEGGRPAAAARRLIMARTRRRDSARPVSLRPAGSTLWKSAAFGSASLAASR